MNKPRLQYILISLILALLVFAALAPTATLAAPPPHTPPNLQPGYLVHFQHLSVDDGLANSAVLSILQDQQGFMWFATEDGLNRYDGYEIKTFRHNEDDPYSISGSYVFSMIETRDGHLWVGTDPTGLNEYNPITGKFTAYRHDPENPNSLSNDGIWSLFEDRAGILWIGTRDGLNRFDRNTGTFRAYKPDPDNPRALSHKIVLRMMEDHNGTLWVATRNGLNRYDPYTDDFTVYRADEANPDGMRANLGIWDIMEDSSHTIWLATRGGGLQSLDPDTGKFTAYQNDEKNPDSLNDNNVWNVMEDSQGQLWVATERGGISHFDRENNRFIAYVNNPNDPYSISHNDIFWLYEDRSGVLWAGSRRGGVNLLVPAIQRFAHYRSVSDTPISLSSGYISSIIVNEDLLWVATQGGGLNRINRATQEVKYFQHKENDPASISSDSLYDMLQARDGMIWITTEGGGLNRYNPRTETFTTYKKLDGDPTTFVSDFLTGLAEAPDGTLWVGTLGYGLQHFDPKTETVIGLYRNDPNDPQSLSEDTIYTLTWNPDGKLWISTARGGASLFDPQADTFQQFTNIPGRENQISSNMVYDIYVSANRTVWFGTVNGLCSYDPANGQFRSYADATNNPSSTIYSIAADNDGFLWLGTGQGLARFDPSAQAFRTFNVMDGLQSNQFNMYARARDEDGEMFFGGPDGLTAFYPQQLGENSYEPPVVLTDFQLFNKSIPTGSEILPRPISQMQSITLDYEDRVFTLGFAALNYQLPEKNQYQYMLEGFDEDWRPPSTQRQATYTNLPPGSYTFKVRASNNDGVWAHTPLEVKITIRPAWWQTWWFRLVVVALVLGGAYAAISWRWHTITQLNRDLENRVLERTIELRQANEQLEQLARIDGLTGLINRRYFYELAGIEFTRAGRYQHPMSIILLDLDRFKNINDTYGHDIGDRGLLHFVETVKSALRGADIFARHGGEEFIILLPETSLEQSRQVAERMCEILNKNPMIYGGERLSITASMGIADTQSCPGCENLSNLVRMADRALYQAKSNGRNRVETAEPDSFQQALPAT